MAPCLVDAKMPEEAKLVLSRHFELIELSTSGITYDAISGHPDIFFCNVNGKLVSAPNLPEEFKGILNKKNIKFSEGLNPVRDKYPESAVYNAVCSGSFLIHRTDITDPFIIDASAGLEKIYVSQGYTRCSLLPLKNNSFITSDAGINNVISGFGMNILYVNPAGILLPGFSHGFFGGVCGVFENTVFITGSLDHFTEGQRVRDFLYLLKYDIIELYCGPLFDCGSILITE